jgi:uncharacterized protein (TIGR02996 family)
VQLELLKRLARDPTDVQTRRVLADVLLEAGSPRGEYLALSLKPTQSATLKKRLAKLFKRHRLEWLGPLSSVVVPEVEPEVWELGFPVRVACRLDGSTVGAQEWLTVREVLVVAPNEAGEVPLELHAVTTPNLRAVYAFPARWSSREGLVEAPRWPEVLRSWLTVEGRGELLDVASEWGHDIE